MSGRAILAVAWLVVPVVVPATWHGVPPAHGRARQRLFNRPSCTSQSPDADSPVVIRCETWKDSFRGAVRAELIVAEDARGNRLGRVALEVLNLTQDAGSAESRGTLRLRPLLSGLIVQPPYRRRGLAQKLVREAEHVANAWGYEELLLQVEDANTPALELYRSLGYRLSDGTAIPPQLAARTTSTGSHPQSHPASTGARALFQACFEGLRQQVDAFATRAETLSLRKDLGRRS
jgi:GNAT superfamily N-acetyltransferase